MRILSQHKCAKFGCFISINYKIWTIYLGVGRFQPNFRCIPPAAKQLMGPKKVWQMKWWHGPPLFIIIRNLVEIERRTSAWEDEVWCFSLFFVNNARPHNDRKRRSCVIQEEIASVFVGRFRCSLQHFFRGRKALSNRGNGFENCR